MDRGIRVCALMMVGLLALATRGWAQPLGTYSWQLAPFCNVVSVNVTQAGGTYTLDGYDAQCGGASNRAPVTGMAVPNPNGTIGLGLTIVTSPNGTPVHVDAAITLGTLGGTWRDSLGHTGTFIFTPSGAGSGSPRPLVTVALPDGSVTAPKLADGAVAADSIAAGAVGASAIDSAQVQRRITGTCPTGQLMSGVLQDGSVACNAASASGGDITAVVAGAGITGGGSAGDVTLGVDFGQVQARVAAACPPGESIRAIAANGTTECLAGAASSGDVTAVIAGAGLSGGGASGDVPVAVDFAQVQARVAASCAAGEAVRAINADGSLACDLDDNAGGDITTIVAGAGLSGGSPSGDATLAVAFAGTGVADLASRADHTHALGAGLTNTIIGAGAFASAPTGQYNTLLGLGAATAANGSDNVVVGASSLQSGVIVRKNVVVGNRALAVTFGDDNVAVGVETLARLGSGNDNVAVGASALTLLIGGSGNVALGASAGSALTTGSHNLYLDGSAQPAEDATIRIGHDVHTRAFIAGVRGVTTGNNNAQAVMIDSNGQLGTVSSSRHTKFDIADLAAPATAALHALRPVQFRYRQAFADGSMPIQYGLIAEEVRDVLPELVALDVDGQPTSVKYHVLPALLLAEVQRLERARAAQEAAAGRRHAEHEAMVGALRGEIAALRARLDARAAPGDRR